jgi:hypothetical protein
LFKGKLVTLCGRITQIPLSINGTSVEEEFEVIKFIENNTQFSALLGKTWIEKDQTRRNEEKETLEKKKQDLIDFMTRKITYLMEEQGNRSKLFDTRDLDVKVVRTLEEPQRTKMNVPDDEEVFPLNPKNEYRQHEVTMSKEDKNQNEKRITKMKLIGKKYRKTSKKKAQIKRL